jgi:hypothetical protein
VPDTAEPWNLTPAQRLQFREAHAEAKCRVSEPVHTSQSPCPVCGCDPDQPWGCDCDNPDCPCSEREEDDDVAGEGL